MADHGYTSVTIVPGEVSIVFLPSQVAKDVGHLPPILNARRLSTSSQSPESPIRPSNMLSAPVFPRDSASQAGDRIDSPQVPGRTDSSGVSFPLCPGGLGITVPPTYPSRVLPDPEQSASNILPDPPSGTSNSRSVRSETPWQGPGPEPIWGNPRYMPNHSRPKRGKEDATTPKPASGPWSGEMIPTSKHGSTRPPTMLAQVPEKPREVELVRGNSEDLSVYSSNEEDSEEATTRRTRPCRNARVEYWMENLPPTTSVHQSPEHDPSNNPDLMEGDQTKPVKDRTIPRLPGYHDIEGNAPHKIHPSEFNLSELDLRRIPKAAGIAESAQNDRTTTFNKDAPSKISSSPKKRSPEKEDSPEKNSTDSKGIGDDAGAAVSQNSTIPDVLNVGLPHVHSPKKKLRQLSTVHADQRVRYAQEAAVFQSGVKKVDPLKAELEEQVGWPGEVAEDIE
ncbi:hypothetical protein ACLMJK_004129 [Lecanora helva]